MNAIEVVNERMTMIFNEWAKRYAAAPAGFQDILDANGEPEKDYGKLCAAYFSKIATELDASGILPRINDTQEIAR